MQSTQWQTVKSPCDIKLDLDCDFEFADNAVNSVTIRDGKGGAVRILRGEYAALKVTVPQPPKKVKKWKLAGTLLNVVIEELFDEQYEAEEKRREFYSQAGDLRLTIEQVEIEV